MELTTNGVLITDAIKFVQARPKAIGNRLVSILIPKLFSSSIHKINNIKEITNSSPQTEYNEGTAGGSGQKKDPPKEYDEKEQPRGNNASFTLHSYKL
jgi:hypothetical protein